MTYSNEDFTDLVDREIKGQSTKEETTYLLSSLLVAQRWHKELARLKSDAVIKVKELSGDFVVAQNAFFEQGRKADYAHENVAVKRWRKYKEQQQKKIKETKHFIFLIDEKLARIRLWKQEQSRWKPDPSHRLATRKGYYEGWHCAIYEMKGLLEHGMTFEEAFETCKLFGSEQLGPYKNSEDLTLERPQLPNTVNK